MQEKRYRTVLSIAGSDSIGGAGIQADIKTCCALDVFAMTVVTAVTAQNTTGVRSWAAVGEKLLSDQLEAVISDVVPCAVKIGMIPDTSSVKIISAWLRENNIRNVVADPVLVATSGDKLSDETTSDVLLRELFPLCDIVTPNMDELTALTSDLCAPGSGVDERAREILKHVPAVLVKGGDTGGKIIEDLFFTHERRLSIKHRRINTRNTHGTGCTLSTAIAAYMSKGMATFAAVKAAIEYVTGSINAGKDYSFGKGHGPVYHNYMNHSLTNEDKSK